MQTNFDELKKLAKNKTVQTFVLLGVVVVAEELYAKVKGKKSTTDKLIKNVLREVLRYYGEKR